MINIPIWLFILFIIFSTLGLILFSAIVYGLIACIITPIYEDEKEDEKYGTREE